MTDRTMRPAQLLLALTVLAWSSALPKRAEAQAISSNATIYVGGKEDGQKLKNGSNVYINNAQCNNDVWQFDLQGYSTIVQSLEMWVTNNTGTNCTEQANRSSANNTRPVCWQVKLDQPLNNVRGTVSVVVRGRQIFDSDRNADNECDTGIAGTPYKVQFVTLASPTVENTATVTPSSQNPNQISAIFTLYSKIPNAPAGTSTVSGGRTIGISYDKIDNDPLTQYRAYFDHDPNAIPMPKGLDGGVEIDAGAVTCGTGAFDDRAEDGEEESDGGAGRRRPTGSEIDLSTIIQSGKTKGESLSIRDLDEKMIAYDTYTAVSVFAIDGAGNLGYLSPPVCVQRVRTRGYLELCRDGGLDCGELDSCSLSPRNTGSAFWLSACTLAISAWRRRRRSN
jgi:hypothetical protein